ncbi:MAG: FMN-binding glutamate synthase family protein [Nitrososphaerales archaeon]
MLPESERTGRVLDRLFLKGVPSEKGTLLSSSSVVTSSRFSVESPLILSSPLYLGDMSFGALSGVPNIAIAKAAEATGVLAGTGEGGLQKEVADTSRITVQWASARFGVDIGTISKGQAVVIKIGQGAKPGIGGHLPGVKVTRPISETRRIPMGRDAISPAPHHDIYSIEDLGQRILALKEATRKPVFVKVGATNYIPYIASGVARMGGAGIIIDGSGAGTGAAPTVVKNNVGLPIELAVASVDSILKREGLREGFTVVAAGKVSTPEDSLKLIALGADITSLGTAALLALGCLMVHKCHLGFCPAVLTNKITDNQVKTLSLDQSVVWLTNLIRGWTEEMQVLLGMMGIHDINELKGRRDFLTRSQMLNEETLDILGMSDFIQNVNSCKPIVPSVSRVPPDPRLIWTPLRINMLREMAGTTGKSPAEAEISSMGSTATPFIDSPQRIADWLVSDGAQVTRPSIDPYREEIEISTYLCSTSKLRLSAPIFFTHLPEDTPAKVGEIIARTALSMGLLADSEFFSEKYSDRIISSSGKTGILALAPEQVNAGIQVESDWAVLLRIPSSEDAIDRLIESDLGHFANVSGFLIDEDHAGSNVQLELSVSRLDRLLREHNLRSRYSLLAEGNRIRGSDDVFKLVALGADAVGLGRAALFAIGFEEGDRAVVFDPVKSTKHLENFVVAIGKDLRLLAGAAGVSSLSSSLVGNRELLRSIDLDPSIRKQLAVKPAGAA